MIPNCVENASSLNYPRAVKTNIVISVHLAVSVIEVSVAKCRHPAVATGLAHPKAVEAAAAEAVATDHAAVPEAVVVAVVAGMTAGEHFTINQHTRNMELLRRQNIQSKSKICLLGAAGKI